MWTIQFDDLGLFCTSNINSTSNKGFNSFSMIDLNRPKKLDGIKMTIMTVDLDAVVNTVSYFD